jgi:hypothetical protein
MASIITSLFQASSVFGGVSNLFAGDKKTRIADVVIDATLSEVVTLSSTITEHPIETKESISDHIFKNPLKIKIEGYITDSPLKVMGLLELPLQSNSVDKLINNVKSFLPFNMAAKPSQQAYQLLKQLHADRQLMSVVTGFEAFGNMAIEKLEFKSDTDTGERLEFSAELVQINFASVKKTINSSYKERAVKAIASEKVNMGTVEPLQSKLKGGKEWLKKRLTPSREATEPIPLNLIGM